MKIFLGIKWHQVAISLLIGLALGTVFGHWQAKDSFHDHWKKGDMKEAMIERFNKKLHLSDEQKKQIASVFEAKRPRMVALHDEMQPKFEALHSETKAEIRKLLDPSQQKKFDEMSAKMEERWKERRKMFPA